MNQKEVTNSSLAKYIVAESFRKHKIAQESGVTSVRHCMLCVRMGLQLRKQLGFKGGFYNLIAKCLGLPTDSTLRKYKIPTTNEPDGVLHANLAKEKTAFDAMNSNTAELAWERLCSLKFDTMHMKGRMVDNGQGEVVGIAHDAHKPGILEKELEELKAFDRTEEELQNESDNGGKNEVVLPTLAKHFQVFMATTWSPISSGGKRSKHEFIVARYGLKSVDSEFLIPTINEIILTLWHYGFIVNDIIGDGASENRSSFKFLATISAKTILSKHFDATLLKDLPLDYKIAFKHPCLYLAEKGILVFIGGEMPHWAKKFRNALDNKKRELTFRDKRLSLSDLYDIWIASGDGDVSGGCFVKKYKFGVEHFRLNSYNKMRVFLAVQIMSLTMIEMIRDVCKPIEEGGRGYDIGQYSSVIEIFTAVNRLVDIMNGKAMNGNKFLDVELIDQPTHRHTEELLKILKLFTEWKVECKKYPKKFITRESYEDLCWMVFGVVGIACTYLKEDGSCKMHQGRSGTDPLEHLFCKLRSKNSNGTQLDYNQGISTESVGTGGSHLFSRSGGQNAAKAHVEPADYFHTLHKSK